VLDHIPPGGMWTGLVVPGQQWKNTGTRRRCRRCLTGSTRAALAQPWQRLVQCPVLKQPARNALAVTATHPALRRALVSVLLVGLCFTNDSRVYAVPAHEPVEQTDSTERSQAIERELEAKFTQALRLTEQASWEEADKAWSAVLALDPDNGAALSNRGLVRLSLHRLDAALADLQQAVERSPAEPVLHENLGLVYEARGEWEPALEEYTKVLQSVPASATALINRGNVQVSRGAYAEALADYQAAADAETGLAAPREKMALVMAQLGRSDDSIQILRQVVRKYPTYADAHAALAAVLWGAKHDFLSAEDQWARISNNELREEMSELENLRIYSRWPPRMIEYLREFLNLETANQEIESAGFVL